MRRRDLIAATLAAGIAPAARAAAKPVVLELFTSQGCSSCPPAETLLGRLIRRPDVIALAWHVDYWDNLGWRDRFASRAATARQRAYAHRLDSVVFTPALVVDGNNVVVGSERVAVEAAIQAASALPVPVTFSRSEGALAAEIGAASGPVQLQRIVYDPERATDIDAGENDGRQLHEFHIVREADILSEWDGASRRFAVKPAAPGQGLVILVQSPELRVLGAADLPPG